MIPIYVIDTLIWSVYGIHSLIWSVYGIHSLIWSVYCIHSLIWSVYGIHSLIWSVYGIHSLIWSIYGIHSLIWSVYGIHSLIWSVYGIHSLIWSINNIFNILTPFPIIDYVAISYFMAMKLHDRCKTFLSRAIVLQLLLKRLEFILKFLTSRRCFITDWCWHIFVIKLIRNLYKLHTCICKTKPVCVSTLDLLSGILGWKIYFLFSIV